MTINSTTRKTSALVGNGNTHTYPFAFKVFTDADVVVKKLETATSIETTLTLGVSNDYIVTLSADQNSNPGGSITLKSGGNNYNLPSGFSLVITSAVEPLQGTDLTNQGGFYPEVINDALDKATILHQQQQDELDRSIKFSLTNTIGSLEITENANARKNKVISFDNAGELSVLKELGTYRGNWAASTAYVVRDLVKDTSTGNVFFCNTAHTSSGAQPLTTNTHSANWDLIVDAASATTSQNAAASSATAAAASATAAANSATAAATSETNAATSASTATTKATQADTAKTAAETAKTAAETAKTAAETALDSFDDRYLGVKSSNPTLDNDGNALLDGALYFNGTNNIMRVYDLGNTTWLDCNITGSDLTNTNTVAGAITNVNNVGGSIANVNTVATNISSVNTVAGDIAKVVTVANDLNETVSEIETAAADLQETTSEIDTVANAITNVDNVGNNIANVNTVAGIASDVTAVAGNATNVNTVGGSITNVNNVGGSIANVNTCAANITGVNSFAARYRTDNSGNNPSTDNDAGDLFYNQASEKLLVYNGTTSAWEETQTIGNFFINTISSFSGTGGNSATFNGSAYKFTLSNAGAFAQQMIVSINGVIQKPNAGTGQPAEGFALDGANIVFSSAPPNGSDYFIITIGSTVSIGTPSDETITLAKFVHGTSGNDGKFLRSNNGADPTWETVENDKITEGNTTVEVVDTQGNNTYGVIKGSIGYTDGSGNKTTLADALHYTKSGNDFLFQLNQAHDGNNNDIQINVGNTTGEGGLIVEKGTGSGGVDTGQFRYSAIHNSGSWSLKTGGNTNFATSPTQFIPHQNVVPNADSTIDLGLTGTRFRNAYVDTYYGDGSNLTGISTALDSPAITGSLVITAPGTVTHTISNYSPSCQYTITPTGCTVGAVNSSGEFVVTHSSGASVSYTIKATTDSLNLDDSAVVTKTFTAVNLSAPTINSPADPNINTNCVYTITSTTTLDDKLILDFGASTFNYGSVSHGSGSKVGNTVEVTGFGTNNPAVTVQFTSAATYSVKAKAQDTGGAYGDSAYSTTDSITALNPPYSVNYLVLAGGGGGGGSCCGDGSGGGGGGGFRASWNNEGSGGGASSESALTLQPGTVYTITVGDGGPGGDAGGGDGDDSSIVGSDITDVVSIGGGAGATRSDSVDRSAKDGGSGGGGAYGHTNANIAGSGTAGQGHNGGTFSGNPYHPAGAGGGAGGNPSGSDNEHAGPGKASTIRGTSVQYGEGGRGGSSTISTNVVAGGANTGDGGDGGYAGNGAAGGSGIVVLRMATSSYSGTQSGGTVTTSGSDTIISYTTVASNHTYTA